ncbi:ABC transporter ATP-binding protein [Ureibacillus acetophenoni]|uniref:Phosphate ABC transporter ATP-binding protein (PhoT family) n=1 Tax=Ureibacillus acetophenoni TaxID=614649 RepID=A0A285UNI6_9BACL|nr:phosphate ABC transporter ATP-binding protein [Ureibacillus acetophenoni]SOC43454.1 phosphate ABC transporter ATP-binding protein (PhoT family) [Ureibacillus acetophenoni]
MDNLETSIQFQNVSYQRNETIILNNVSGDIYKGKITALVGPSGAGKTTLLKLCNGLISPTNGDILVEHKHITDFEPTSLRRQVGIVLQNAPIIRGSVFENLALPLKLQKKNLSKDEATAMLTTVGLEDSFLNRDASDLSGGQKQKLAIARTLINRPKILLMDEITSALDPISTNEIEQLIVNIKEKYGVTIVWITHNIEQAKELGDFIWVMMKGQLIESGDHSIFSSTRNIKVQQFFEGKI